MAAGIGPKLFKNRDLAEILTPSQKLIFMGLWAMANQKGEIKFDTSKIRGKLTPFCDVEDFQGEIMDMIKNGVLDEAVATTGRILVIRKFASLKSQFLPSRSGNLLECEVESEFSSNGKDPILPIPNAMIEADPLLALPESAHSGLRQSPQGTVFVEKFKATYRAMAGEDYLTNKADYAIAKKLIDQFGYKAVCWKAQMFARMCDKRTAWFTEEGPGGYTIPRMLKFWNQIVPCGTVTAKEKNDRDLVESVKGVAG